MVNPTSYLPQTSSAVNIQIIEPKNFPGGANPGAMLNNGVPQDMFQTQGGGAQQPINPYAPPTDQLQQAYNNALNARNAAEQARNAYLNMANQLNGQAFQQQGQNPFGQGGFPPPQPGMQPQGWPPAPVQQNTMFGPNGLGPNGMPMQPQWPQPGMNPNDPMAQWPQQQPPMQQPPFDPNQMQQPQQPDPMAQQQPPQQPEQPQQPQGLSGVPVEELNQMIANPNPADPEALQKKVNAMEEIGVRGQATPETYQLLTQEAVADTSQLPPGQKQDDANYIRQAALWTLGMLNKAQNAQTPTANLPGLSTIEQIINNRNENSDVKMAAVQALQVIDRPTDKQIARILKKASKDKNPDVKRLAQEALSGKSIPLPQQGGAPAPQYA